MYDNALHLNMQILADYLDDRCSDHVLYQNRDRMLLDGVRLYRGQESFDERYCYLANTEELDQLATADCALILVGDMRPHLNQLHRERPVLYLSERTAEEALEMVQDVFDRFHRWADKLHQIVFSHGTLVDYCNAFMEIIGNPVWVLNRSNDAYLCSSHVVGMLELIPDPDSGLQILPNERKNLLYHTRQFIDTYSTRGAHYWFPPWNKHRDIYINVIDENERYLGRILVMEMQTPLCPSHLRLLEYFQPFIREAIKGMKKPTYVKSTLQRLLERILRQDLANEEQLLEELAELGWRQSIPYIIAAAPLRNLDQTYALSICLDITAHIPDSVAFLFDDNLVAVCRLSEEVSAPESCCTRLHEVGLKDQIHFGLSDPFFSLLRLPEYLCQAEKARAFGMTQDPREYCHPFHRSALAYLLTNAVGVLPPRVACAAALRTLRRVDQEKGSDYYNTLRVYIGTGCQPLRAAKELFLHRGTLSYRLKKICSYTGLDLEDTDTVLYLDLSFRILGLLEPEDKPPTALG
jgi:hypothetical protein